MKLRTKCEQKAYVEGYQMCANCIEKYLTDEGKQILKCLIISLEQTVKITDTIQKSGEVEVNEKNFETVCQALVDIVGIECCDYGYSVACDIAVKYLKDK